MSAPRDVLENPDVRFEKEDIRATPVLKFLVGIAVTTVVVCLLLFGFYRGMRSYVADLQPEPPHMKFEENREAPVPRLQEHPDRDLQAIRAEEDRILTTYGWVDKSRGMVRIPIEEAMKLVAEQGLPATSTPKVTAPPKAGGKAK